MKLFLKNVNGEKSIVKERKMDDGYLYIPLKEAKERDIKDCINYYKASLSDMNSHWGKMHFKNNIKDLRAEFKRRGQ